MSLNGERYEAEAKTQPEGTQFDLIFVGDNDTQVKKISAFFEGAKRKMDEAEAEYAEAVMFSASPAKIQLAFDVVDVWGRTIGRLNEDPRAKALSRWCNEQASLDAREAAAQQVRNLLGLDR